MLEAAEVVQTVERLDAELTDLAIRGLRTVGPQHLTSLKSFHEELERIGAAHLAGRVRTLIEAIEADDRSGAAALMKAQTSLRVFERVLTLEVTSRTLGQALHGPEGAEEDA